MQLRQLATALAITASLLGHSGVASALPIDNAQNVAPTTTGQAAIACQRAGIPAYFGLGPDWDHVVALGRESDFLIVNLADGPGPGARADYRAGIQRAKQSGTKVVGYIY